MFTRDDVRYFHASSMVTVIGLALGAVVGFLYSDGDILLRLVAAGKSSLICGILSILEVSLSFDNAVVNAKVLGNMEDKWKHRFITWGMVIAVFGMRVIFPLIIVGLTANLFPWEAIKLAIYSPHEYQRILESAHYSIAAFGGAFLLLVGLDFFFKADKDIHWIKGIEEFLARLGGVDKMDIAITATLVIVFSMLVPSENFKEVILSGMGGILAYIMVGSLEHLTGGEEAAEALASSVKKGGAAAFIYLEVLDASFSFDGVIGAFALTNNLFMIAIGLGIGAMFVRSLTIMMVDKGTLSAFRYLEHGAFWAILSLAGCMFVGMVAHVPEAVTGLVGAGFLLAAVRSSKRWNASQEASQDAVTA